MCRGCRLSGALWEPTGCMFTVSWIRHLGMACGEMFAVHTICLLQLSCPLPTGPQTRRTDLDPHVTVVSQRCSTFIAFLVYAFMPYLSFNQVHQMSVISMSVPSQALYTKVCLKKQNKQNKTFLSISNLIICACMTTCTFA